MYTLFRQGKIRAIGVSIFRRPDRAVHRVAPLHVLQPPYNLFERAIEADLLPTAAGTTSRRSVTARVSRPPVRRMRSDTAFEATICVRTDRSSRASLCAYLPAVQRSTSFQERSASALLSWRLAGCSIKHLDSAVGARRYPDQLQPVDEVTGWRLDAPAKVRSTGSCARRSPIRRAGIMARRHAASNLRQGSRGVA